MDGKVGPKVRLAALVVAAGALLASHMATALGQRYGWIIAFTTLQVLAEGVVLWSVLPWRRRWLAGGAILLLLAGLALGTRVSVQDGVLTVSGLSHAMLYGGLLAVFGTTLLPGRVALATMFAARLNPTFHGGMVPYTRRVTLAWCLFFTGQIAVSGLLLASGSMWWPAFVTVLHVPAVLAMAAGEFAVRRWRWRHEHYTGFGETIRGVRRMVRQRANSSSARP